MDAEWGRIPSNQKSVIIYSVVSRPHHMLVATISTPNYPNIEARSGSTCLANLPVPLKMIRELKMSIRLLTHPIAPYGTSEPHQRFPRAPADHEQPRFTATVNCLQTFIYCIQEDP